VKTFGLTGGIGMGKSTCAELLRQRGVHVVDTDDLARELVHPGQPALGEITTAFGTSFLDGSGQLRRSALAELVFVDPAARARLESILHPKITAAWIAHLAAWRGQGITMAVVVIPLLFETGAESHFTATVCVACSPGTQQSRLRARGWSEAEIRRRSAAQLGVEEKMTRAGHVLWSEGGLAALGEQAGRVFVAG
jgi:dephospho-CoA kinase